MSEEKEDKPQKPHIRSIMMLSAVHDEKLTEILGWDEYYVPGETFRIYSNTIQSTKEKVTTWILPIRHFRVTETTERNILEIFDLPESILEKIPRERIYKRCALSFTDDPRVEWAGDWSDLGCFRMAFKFVELKMSKKNGILRIESPKGKYGKDTTTPDKPNVLRFKQAQMGGQV